MNFPKTFPLLYKTIVMNARQPIVKKVLKKSSQIQLINATDLSV